ncbi:MAG: UDP-2,4-diacetamido-2,4,6-trideoxy-beta-L-altropyranose hydrolase [Paraglaciecola sp.]|jgi:UDP-2,4-diacetamido-2,4,6-trideoxy-beta-L-altropyranose hydrolase
MRVVFRVEGEPTIGLGHVMRCMALAQRLVVCRHDVFFFMSQTSQPYCQNRTDWLGEILVLPDIDKDAEPQWLAKKCSDLNADWLVLDGYQFDQDYRQSLQSNVFKLAVFDDMNNSGALCADMVINGAPNAALHSYQLTAPNALLAIGQGYQVLRQEFLQSINKQWSDRKSLTLIFGGSDPNNLTVLVLQFLHNINASMPITIITGAAYNKLSDLADLIKGCALNITHLHDCQNMAEVLVNSKLALSAAGGSQFELLACATPSILVVVAENQKNASQDAASQGWCKVVNSDDCSADELAMRCLSLWQQPECLSTMHQKALLYPAVDGAKNIVALMSDQKMTSGDV